MRIVFLAFCLTVSAMARAGDAAPAASKPRTHAMVPAIGTSFNVATEKQSTGSHLPPYHRRGVDAGDSLDLPVLHELDQQMAALSTDRKRILLSFASTRLPNVPRAHRARANLVGDPDAERLGLA